MLSALHIHSLEGVCSKLSHTSFGKGPVLSIPPNEGGANKPQQRFFPGAPLEHLLTVHKLVPWQDSNPVLTGALRGRALAHVS